MTVLWRFVRDRRRSFIGWGVGVSAYIVLNNAFFPSFKDQEGLTDVFEGMPESMKSLFGFSDAVSLTEPAGYLWVQTFSQFPVLLTIFAISLGVRAMATSEEDGTLELLLSNPITRLRVVSERCGGFVALVAALGVVTSALTLATAPVFQLTEGVSIPGYVAASFGAIALALLFGSLAFAVGAISGRRGPALAAAGVAAVATYVFNGLVGAVEAARPLRFLSPWHWLLSRNMLALGIPAQALLVPLPFIVAFVAFGIWAFRRRDLVSG